MRVGCKRKVKISFWKLSIWCWRLLAILNCQKKPKIRAKIANIGFATFCYTQKTVFSHNKTYMSRSEKSWEVQICNWLRQSTISFRFIGVLLVPTWLMLFQVATRETEVTYGDKQFCLFYWAIVRATHSYCNSAMQMYNIF